ncbi:MAG TPA: WecB/TagA/CpsF family glycosyltransferase [Phnomibacter sp.]|nr:WecB/TagA/CpsF family glycosyltransferase [Phnomibacter sp.]
MKRSAYVCVANVHMTIEAHSDQAFANIVNNAHAVTPDGMPLVVALRILYGVVQERVTGMDLLPDLLRVAEKENFTVFFYGGTESMLKITEQHLATNYPGITEKHFYSPPFRSLSSSEEQEDILRINSTGANIVFVALGCPKQEKWMASMMGRINACMIGIGGALPVMIGLQKRAPLWMQKGGLEWFYRFMQEPGRLFKRYAITNARFCWLLSKAWLKQGLRSIPDPS